MFLFGELPERFISTLPIPLCGGVCLGKGSRARRHAAIRAAIQRLKNVVRPPVTVNIG